ncbi:RE1, partial [Symbiodinium sp. KB8]
ATGDGGNRGASRGPMDAFGLLAQGIAQLQTAMSATMAHKAQEMEVVKPGISELPKLPELSETSCIDIGDWVHALECPMGDLSNGSAGWWKEVLQCLDRFYEAYLTSTNIGKLSLKPETFATAAVKDERWSRVDKRATSMILLALPDAVKGEILASRLTGTLAVMGRVMVLYRPGSAAERQQILKALEAPSVMLAFNARMLAFFYGDWMNMMRYTLEVDSKPTQKAVEAMLATVAPTSSTATTNADQDADGASNASSAMKWIRSRSKGAYFSQLYVAGYYGTRERTSCSSFGGFGFIYNVTTYFSDYKLSDDFGDIRELLREANSMLKEMRPERLDAVKMKAALVCWTQVKVQLANGQEIVLAQNRAGTLLASSSTPEDASTPIVPLGALVQDLNCELTWGRKKGLQIKHPVHGVIRPRVVGRCPIIGEAQALDLIRELEDQRVDELRRTTMATQRALWMWDERATWSQCLERFLQSGKRADQLQALEAEDSPFAALGSTTRSSMAEESVLDDRAGWNYLKALPISRRKRKQLMTRPWLVNLFSGPFPTAPELKVLEDGCVLVELDITRSRAHDLRHMHGAYRALCWAAATGRISGFMASPPLRSPGDEELLAKAMWCSVVAKAANNYHGNVTPFILFEGKKVMSYMFAEERADGSGMPRTWSSFTEVMFLEKQGEALVTNLDYDKAPQGTTTSGGRWSEEFNRATADAILKWRRQPENRQLMRWLAKMDAGNFLGSLTVWIQIMLTIALLYLLAKYEMGVHTEAKYEMGVHTEAKYEMGVAEDVGIGVGPLRDWRDEDLVEEQEPVGLTAEEEGRLPKGMTAEEFQQVFHQVGGVNGYRVIYVASPLRSRTTKDVLYAVQDLYLRLRAQGCHISRVHADRARELRSDPLKRWLASRGTYTTYTEGQSPQSNGRAEAAVKYVKVQMKRLLMAGNFSARLWPMALRYATWSQMQKQLYPDKAILPFGTRVHVKRKVYGVGNRYDLESRWAMGYYLGPSADVNEGSVIMMDKGNFITTVHMRPNLVDASREVELEEYQAVVSIPSRRLRRKATLNPGDHEGLRSLPLPQAEEEETQPVSYDPNHPAEEYARAVLKEERIERDFVETLAGLLPTGGAKPKRFGERHEEEMVWSTGAFVHGGVVGLLNNAKKFPRATKVFLDYIKQQCPGFRCNSLAVFRGIHAERHRDAHNVGTNVVLPLTDFKGCDIVVKRDGKETILKVSEGPQYFDPHEEHYTTPCTEGTSLMLVGDSIRDSTKLNIEAIDYLEDLGFEWHPHRAKEERGHGDEGGKPRVSMMKGQVKIEENAHKEEENEKTMSPNMDYVNHDLDVAIQDMEDRATRLRDLLEEEEIMVEQANRLGVAVREELGDTRDFVCKYLDDVHRQLMRFQLLRERVLLSSARQVEEGDQNIDYERLLDELEGDLDIVHTVPLDQVKRVLHRWTAAIEKEVKTLFSSGTLGEIDHESAKALEARGELKVVPAKCVFTLKPPTTAGERCRRKCRMVIWGNHIARDGEDQASLYAAGTSTDALRLALSLAASKRWLAAIADITSAFLLAEWPPGMPRYALTQPKVIRDSGNYGSGLWVVQRPLYGLRESPAIWSEFRNSKLRQIKINFRGRTLGLKQAVSESELWLLQDEQTKELHGLLVVYVDDLMYLAEGPVVESLHKAIMAMWPISNLEWIDGAKSVRYLGVEIKQNPDNKIFSISQQAYIAELLRAHNMQSTAHTQLPAPREWLDAVETSTEEAEAYTEGDLRMGQRIVGEALWLATKTRPDILFVVNSMASHVSRRPRQIIKIGERLLSYLAGTADLELVLAPPRDGARATMTCFTDASFAPYGARSYGAAVIVFGQAPISWKAGKQSFVTMSTMEAELYAAAQGFILLQSVASILSELQLGRLIVQHTPGEEQLADLATKVVTKTIKLKLMIFLMTVVSLVNPVDGRSGHLDSKEDIPISGWDELLVVSVMLCISAIACWELSKYALNMGWKYYKGKKKEMKLNRVRRMAADAAMREVEVAERSRSDESAMRGSTSSTESGSQLEQRGASPSGLLRRRVLDEDRTRSSSSGIRTDAATTTEGAVSNERIRVIKDVLNLMTVERLREALRFVGLPVSGIKQDVVDRLAPQLGYN